MDDFTLISHKNRPLRLAGGKSKKKLKKTRRPISRSKSRRRSTSRSSKSRRSTRSTRSRISRKSRKSRISKRRRTTGVRSSYEILSLIGYKKPKKSKGAKKKK